ncbi:hypothetical protein [Devosia sp.]|uniref:hypothetical protein n=1 Tax=Devosia sp. TaxID=1871048 RepID=UPI003BAC0CD1
MIVASLRHNLARLLRFHGRDSSRLFWPYALLVSATLLVAVQVTMQSSFQRSLTAVDFATVDFGEFVRAIFLSMIPLYLAAVSAAAVLLSAAIVRRLRDGGKHLAWGALPLVPAIATPLLYNETLSTDEVVTGWFFATFFANLLTIGFLITLVVKLNAPTARSSV